MPLARVDVRIPSRALLRDFKSPKAAFISLSFHHRRVLFRFSAAAQASLHRPAPRTRSRATLIPLLRPLDRRKELLSHISPVSSTALILILRYLRFTSATHAFCDRSPFLCRRANFLCRRSTFLCRRKPHAARPQHPPSRAYRHSNPPDLPSVLRQSAVHRLAIPCPPVRTSDRRVRPYCRSRLVVPAISFTSTTHLVSLFREAFTGCLCRIPPRTV